MKKIIALFAVCVMVLFCTTSCKEESGLNLTPSSVTLKVGESVFLKPSIQGDDIEISDVMRINPEDGVCFLDEFYKLTGEKVGVSRVGIGVLKDKDDINKGLKYSAFTTVTVVE